MLKQTLFAAVALVHVTASTAGAHDWQEEATDIPTDVVESVLDALDLAATNALDIGWKAPPDPEHDSVRLIDAYTIDTDSFADLPEETYRVLYTYEAWRLGVIDATGQYSDSADPFYWTPILRPEDVIVLVPYRDRFDAWWRTMEGTAK